MAINPETLRAERALHNLLLGMTDEQTRAITGQWVAAWESVRTELELSLAELTAAAPRGRVTRTMILRHARAQAALAAMRDALTVAAQSINVTLGADLWRVVHAATEAEHEMIASQLTGTRRAEIQASLVRADPGQIAAMVNRATEQITALTLPLAAETSAVIKAELLRGISLGVNPRAAARRMVQRAEDRTNFGLSRALTIARTEMMDAAHQAAYLTDQANASVLAGWVWVAHLDLNTCPSCIAMNGTLHPLEEPGPYDHQNGRCARVPKTKSWSDLGFKGIQDPPDLTPDADAWFAKLSADQQRSILGPKGYTAWKEGRFPREKWATRRSNPGWRDSYHPTRPPS